jgi:hypothetical protein
MRLAKTSLAWALRHIERFGDTDIFPLPFEFEAARASWGTLLPELENVDVSNYQTGEFRRALTPKSRYGFRVATQLHPVDSIIFSALVYEIAKDLEASRVPKRLDVVMSHRIKRSPGGQLYDPGYNFECFKARLRALCAEKPKWWVVSTDIADFYNRIYHHPLQNALGAATKKGQHVKAIMRMLSQWTYGVSYGIPVGPAPTRILAEVVLADVDRALLDEDIEFCRFSDDFRLFAKSEREAFSQLAKLANYLHENHGLHLSERKTDITTVERFVQRHLEGNRPGDSARLSDQVGQILETYGRKEDAYAALDVNELPEELVRELDALNLNDVLRDQVNDNRIFDNFAVSIALRRLAQLKDATVLDLVVDSIESLTTVLPQVINFVQKVTPLDRREEIGARLLRAIEEGASGHKEYQEAWLLSMFVDDASWNNRDALVRLLPRLSDDISRPMLLQAVGIASHAHWFRSSRRTIQSLGGWQRRAFLRGAMCMSQDEYTHWVNSLIPRLDSFDQTVAKHCLSERAKLP